MLAQLLASEEGQYWLPHDIGEVIVGTLALVIVVGLLAKFAGPMIAKAMSDRTERIAGELEEAAADRREGEATLAQVQADLADRESRIAEIRAEAEAAAAKLEADLVAKAEADAAAVRERGAADREAARRQAQADLSAELSRVSLAAAEQLVTNHLDAPAQNDLIDAYIAGLPARN